jgi:hypothetical protein
MPQNLHAKLKITLQICLGFADFVEGLSPDKWLKNLVS